MNELDRSWLAGLLEGEGCFSSPNRYTPSLTLAMTDEDVVFRAASLMGATLRVHRYEPGGRETKATFRVIANGEVAAGIMRELYPLMGHRRQGRIRELLSRYNGSRHYEKTPRGEKHGQHALSETQVRLIRFWLTLGVPETPLAKAFGVDQTTISDIKTGRSWAGVPADDGLVPSGAQ